MTDVTVAKCCWVVTVQLRPRKLAAVRSLSDRKDGACTVSISDRRTTRRDHIGGRTRRLQTSARSVLGGAHGLRRTDKLSAGPSCTADCTRRRS